jgi:hypothetical protein
MSPSDYSGHFEEIDESGRPGGSNGKDQGLVNILPYEWSASLKLELETNDFVEGVLTEGCLADA